MNLILMLLKNFKKIAVKFLEIVLIATVGVLVIDVLWGVVSRYVLSGQSSWTDDLASMLLIWEVLLGSAYAFGQKAHLGVDYLVEKFDSFSKCMTALFVNIVCVTFAVAVFIYGGTQEVLTAFESQQMIISLGVPKAYVYLAIPVTGLFFVMFGVEAFFEELVKLKNGEATVATEEN
ncbi:TRAP transporter small permease [Lentisphaerota bacterium WC36G]|nr:TRAP transporter small permease [Lentisphaerae bacterium WC36]